MKTIAATLSALLFALTLHANDSINAIIGDQSISEIVFVRNYMPDDRTRIELHLAFVERELRKKDVSHLSETARQNRLLRLNELNEYWKTGIFPHPVNPDKSRYTDNRRPCFIDQDGRVCAVGYLVEQSAGREVAESINVKHKFEYLLNMNDPVIDQWAEENGFTLKELAMIQPTYGWYEPTPIVYRIEPSKKEIALQAKLDSLIPAHDSVVKSLDSMTLRVKVLELDLEQKEKDLQIQALRAKKKEVQSRSKIHSKQKTIYGMSASLAVLLGLSLFQFFRFRANKK